MSARSIVSAPKRIATSAIVSVALLVGFAAPVQATQSGTYFSGGLSSGRAFAAQAQAGIWQQKHQGYACTALEQGFAGYGPPGQAYTSTTFYCGTDIFSYPGAPSGGWHAVVFNDRSYDISVANAWYWY